MRDSLNEAQKRVVADNTSYRKDHNMPLAISLIGASTGICLEAQAKIDRLESALESLATAMERNGFRKTARDIRDYLAAEV